MSAINVYSLQEDKMAKTVRISNRDYKVDDVMHLNLYENHFSYIKKFKSHAKKIQYLNCTRILNQACHLQRHVKKCQTEVKEVFKGVSIGIRKPSLNYWIRLIHTFRKTIVSILILLRTTLKPYRFRSKRNCCKVLHYILSMYPRQFPSVLTFLDIRTH